MFRALVRSRPTISQVRFFARKAPTRRPPPAAASAAPAVVDPWVSVKDESSGQIYWWNQDTDETTGLGEPKPMAAAAPGGVPGPAGEQQRGGMMSGLGGVVAEGFAFGVGSSIARNVVGSFFDNDDEGGGADF
jgi:hypothetical protein